MFSVTSLVQTIGRAARNVDGKVIMYADNMTESMERAISETYRRREIQQRYNREHGITPKTIQKEIREVLEISTRENTTTKSGHRLTPKEKEALIAKMTADMRNAAKLLEFEHAAFLRDEIIKLQKS